MPAQVTDLNGLVTQTIYDNLGRIDTILHPDNTTTENDYLSCTSCFAYSSHEHWYLQTKTTGSSAIRTYFDRLDRKVGTRSRSLDGTFVYTTHQYDTQGNVGTTTDPFFTITPENLRANTHFEYDLLNRSTRVDYADGSYSTTTYSGLGRTQRNQNGQEQDQIYNGAGWVMQSADNNGTPVDFTYSPWGDLKTTKVNGNNDTLVQIDYDVLGRKIQLNDPNTGTIGYVYNALGLLAQETDAINQVTRYSYDKLERQLTRTDDATGVSNPARTHTWTYDELPANDPLSGNIGLSVGQVVKLDGINTDASSYLEIYEYKGNNVGLPSKTITTIGGGAPYELETIYDEFSRQVGTIYPTGFATSQYYNDHGHLYQIENASNNSGIWRALSTDARGNLTRFELGNGVETDQTFDDKLGRIKTIRAYKGTFELQEQEYNFDSLGNLTWRKETRDTLTSVSSVTENFCYDAMNRLVAQEFDAPCTGQSDYSYDVYGNITSKGSTGSYGYGAGAAGPNAVTSVGSLTYSYDNNGNLTGSSNGTSVSYASFNKPTTITKGSNSSTVVYNPNQDRVKRIDNNGMDQTTSIYVSLGLYEEITNPQGLTDKASLLG